MNDCHKLKLFLKKNIYIYIYTTIMLENIELSPLFYKSFFLSFFPYLIRSLSLNIVYTNKKYIRMLMRS